MPDPKDAAKAAKQAAREAFMREFGRRCKQARGDMSIEAAIAVVGVHRNTIWNIERGDSLPDAFELELLAKAYNTTPEALMGKGEGSSTEDACAVAKSLTAVERDGFIYVPQFDVRVSAGHGSFNDLEAVTDMLPFNAAFIQQELGIRHLDLAISVVNGVSMEPWLRSRDKVLTDLRDKEALTEGVHVVRVDGALLLKKLQRLPGKILRVSSFNPSYEPFDIQTGDDSDRDFQIIGRVRWGGVNFS